MPFRSWAIVRLDTGASHAGLFEEIAWLGVTMLSVKVPGAKPGEWVHAQLVAPAAVREFRPASEAQVRAAVAATRPKPAEPTNDAGKTRAHLAAELKAKHPEWVDPPEADPTAASETAEPKPEQAKESEAT